jgi:hypothetical protein
MSIKTPKGLLILGVIVAAVFVGTVLFAGYANVPSARVGGTAQVKSCPVTGNQPCCEVKTCPAGCSGACCGEKGCMAQKAQNCCGVKDCPAKCANACCDKKACNTGK